MSRQIRIQEQLCQAIHFSFLNIEDESNQHHVPENAQTHFKIIAVSTEFFGLSRIDRHRAINQLLKNEFETGLHALSLHLYTPEEWDNQKNTLLKSPACRDGFNRS